MTTTSIPNLTTGFAGIDLPGMPAAPRPDRLRRAGTDLFAGVTAPGRMVDLTGHRALWSRQPALPMTALVAAAQAADLRGAGGAGFPTHRKLQSVAEDRVSLIVINASEGEETSAKDGQLLAHVPHLVLDGAAAVAHATGCRKIVVHLGTDRSDISHATARAIQQRDDQGISWSIHHGADRFVHGEASAVIHGLAGRDRMPGDIGKPPRNPRGLRRSHVFLSNVETFARLALASRGRRMTTALVTTSGAVDRPGVYEVPSEWTVADLAAATGADPRTRLLITGGWHGAWIAGDRIAAVPLDRDHFQQAGARWGAGALIWVPAEVRPQQALAAVTAWLAAQSAGQCGPCVAGLPALAGAVARGSVTHELSDVDGRGLCAHPSATAAAVRSALSAIRDLDERAIA